MIHVDSLSRSPVEVEVMITNINEDDLVLSAQLQDDSCKWLIEVLSHSPNNAEEDCIDKNYCLRDNRLYRVTPTGKKWVIPKSVRRRILMYYHDGAGHFAVDKTLETISQRYWFSSMRKYVKNYIKSRLGCMYNKVPAGKTPGRLNPIPKESIPLDTLHIDHLGPFVKSIRNNSYFILSWTHLPSSYLCPQYPLQGMDQLSVFLMKSLTCLNFHEELCVTEVLPLPVRTLRSSVGILVSNEYFVLQQPHGLTDR